MKKLFYLWVVISMVACNGEQSQQATADKAANGENITENTTIMNEQPVKLILDSQAKLGEGPIWHPDEKKLFWVDIEGFALHIFDPATQEDKVFEMGQRIGTVVPMESGNVAVALEDGVYTVDLQTGELTLFANPLEGQENIRFNDGKCDPAGRLWVGSMALNAAKGAADLYCIHPDGTFEQKVDSVTISNGIVWSNDATKMYYIDTPTRVVKAFDYDLETGNISNPSVAVEIPKSMGSPDGMAIDSEGMLWIGMWGGNAVTRWDPQTGELLGKIEVPAKNVTACAFGGDDLKTLYITTARLGTSQEELKELPKAGGLFAVEVATAGAKSALFKR